VVAIGRSDNGMENKKRDLKTNKYKDKDKRKRKEEERGEESVN
jgi:hypothetical protein